MECPSLELRECLDEDEHEGRDILRSILGRLSTLR